MNTSEQIDQLVAALSEAQGEFVNPERNRTVKVATKTGGSYTFDYATFDAILAATRPILKKHGLAVLQGVRAHGTEVTVTTRVAHASGQWVQSEITGTADALSLQSIGSAVTYLKRYAYTAMLNIAAEEDDDGIAGAGHEAEKTDRPARPSCPKCGNNSHVIQGKAEYGGGWLCWKNKGGCGEKWGGEAKQDRNEPVELSVEDARYIADASKQIQDAHDELELDAISELIAKRSEAVRKALIPIGKAKRNELRTRNASSQPEAATA